MDKIRVCEECGATLAARAPLGLCPRCLVQMAVSLGGTAAGEPTSPDPEADLKRRGFGDYELLGQIGRGGMGVVYRARQISLNRIVAVKMLLFGQFSGDEFVKRFQAEAEAVASLNHPNIVTIYEVGDHQGQHFFSMEYVDGQTLADLVRDKPPPAREAASYLKAIAEAVHHAHEHGVLHRDLKPSNVLIDAFGQPRVMDFGLAKRLTSPECGSTELTLAGQVLGSPSYMAPEQARGDGPCVGPASDIYSLGAILYHLLTGRAPFLAGTVEETLAQLQRGELVAPRLLNPSIPRDLETICLKCLNKEPPRRYLSAQGLADDLERWLSSKPILARATSPPEKLWRWCRRKPALAAAIALLAAIAGGSVIAAIQLHRSNEQARENLYVADLNVALRDFQEGNTAQSFALLKRWVPARGETDLRDFQWRYLWRLCRGTYSHWLPTHKQVVGSIHFSPDGEFVATYCWNDTVRVWNLATRQRLYSLEKVTGLGGFSEDGKTIAISRGDGKLQLCEARMGVSNSFIANAGDLVAFAAQPQTAVTITRDNVLKVWDNHFSAVRLAVPGVTRRKSDYGWGGLVCIARDGKLLGLVEANKNPLRPNQTIRLWDLESGKEQAPISANREVRCLSFSPDGRLLAIGDGEGNVALWSLNPREVRFFRAHETPVLSLAFTSDGQTLATGSSGTNSIRLWETATGSSKTKTFSGQVGDVWSLAFSPDGKFLASGTRDGPIRIWEVGESDSGEIVADRLHADEYGNFLFSPDSKLIAGGCADNTVKIWDVGTLRVRAVLSNASYVAAFSKDSKNLLVSTQEGAPHWRNVDGQTSRPLPSYEGDIHRVVSVALAPNENMAALGMPNGSIQLLDMETGRSIGARLTGHNGPVRSLAFSPSGDKLASGGSDKTVMVWDIKTGRGLSKCLEHKGGVFGVAVSPNGKMLASGCGAETIKFWDMDNMSTGSLASISYHKSVIRTLAFSPDGKLLASGSDDNTVKLWSLALRREVASFRHGAHLRQVSFSPDGNALASVTDKGTLRVLRAVTLKEADEDLKRLQ